MNAPARCDRASCPAPSHDTSSAYRVGCRSEAARAAVSRVAKRRRHGLHQPRLVVDVGTGRRLRALAAMGWHVDTLAAELGITRWGVNKLRNRDRHNVGTVARVEALYDRLSMTPGGDEYTAAIARRKRWAPPLAWDDPSDPAERPKWGMYRPGVGRRDPAEVRAEVLRLDRGDLTIAEIAETVGVHRRTVERIRVEQAGQVAA